MTYTKTAQVFLSICIFGLQ